jgi:hypothetical protein
MEGVSQPPDQIPMIPSNHPSNQASLEGVSQPPGQIPMIPSNHPSNQASLEGHSATTHLHHAPGASCPELNENPSERE